VIEAASGMDPDAIQSIWQAALDKLLQLWKTLTGQQRAQLAEQIAAAVEDDDLEALGNLAVDSDDAAEALAEALGELADESAEQLVAEAASQGVTISGAISVGVERLTELARTIARLLASGLADAAAREALRVWAPGRTADEVADLVTEHLEGLSESYLHDQLGGALSAAQSAGRMAALREAPEATYVASEILDRNTCKACSDIDGTEFESLEAADAAYPMGIYFACLGGPRCRGQVIAIWDEE
jgi:Glu-tRNA(Gln) amidotransferase subunit E-like FAD-binding protein